MHLELQKTSTCGTSLLKLREVVMKGKTGWGSSFFRQGDALQTRPVLGVAARSTDRKPSSFLDKQVGWLQSNCQLAFKASSAHLRSSGSVPGMGWLLPGQRRPELTFSVSNAFSPLSVHSEAGQGLEQTNSHLSPGDFNGSPVDPLEEASKFKADGRMAGGAVANGGRLYQEADDSINVQ